MHSAEKLSEMLRRVIRKKNTWGHAGKLTCVKDVDPAFGAVAFGENAPYFPRHCCAWLKLLLVLLLVHKSGPFEHVVGSLGAKALDYRVHDTYPSTPIWCKSRSLQGTQRRERTAKLWQLSTTNVDLASSLTHLRSPCGPAPSSEPAARVGRSDSPPVRHTAAQSCLWQICWLLREICGANCAAKKSTPAEWGRRSWRLCALPLSDPSKLLSEPADNLSSVALVPFRTLRTVARLPPTTFW